MRIVILGNSPLAFFVAQGLNNDIARYAHLEVIWLTSEREVSFPASWRLLAPSRSAKKAAALPNVRIVTDQIKSVSAAARRVVTDKRVIEFDYLFLDQSPWYCQEDLKEVGRALQRLVVQLKTRKDIRAAGAIRLRGQGALTWQLALSIRAELRRLKNRQVAVEVERPRQRIVTDFLQENGIATEYSTRPGFTVAAPAALFPSRKVKGIRIDQRERAIVDAGGLAGRGVLIIDQANTADRTLWRALEGQARRITQQLEQLVTEKEPIVLDREPIAFVLRFERSLLMKFDKATSRRVRARFLYKLDSDLWKRLLSRHG